MPERTSSAGKRAGVGDLRGVEAPRPLVNAQKYAKNKYKPPEYINIQGSKRVGKEGSLRKGGQETIHLRKNIVGTVRDQASGQGRQGRGVG